MGAGMKRFKIKTEVCFSENTIDVLTEIKGQNAVMITDSFMVESGTRIELRRNWTTVVQ